MDLERLRSLFQRQMLDNDQAVRAFPWHDPDSYALYLKQTWGFVSHSCALLGLSSTRLKDQPVLQKRFIDHMSEEFGHEELAKRDIIALGYDFDSLPVLSITKAMVNSQYYHIYHNSPYALFGYILLLETLPIQCADLLPLIIEKHGSKAAGFLKLHVEEDVEHSASAWDAISTLSSDMLQFIYDNFEESSDNYCTMLRQTAARTQPSETNVLADIC